MLTVVPDVAGALPADWQQFATSAITNSESASQRPAEVIKARSWPKSGQRQACRTTWGRDRL